MKETNMIPQITKLLKNFIFNDFNLDFNISISPNRHSNYLLTVYLDPEVMCMSGDKYNPDSDSFLYELGENIDEVLPYIGLTDEDLILQFKFLNEEEFSNKLRGMINGIIPTLYNRIENLPKLHSINVGQRWEHYEFEMNFKFYEVPKIDKIRKLYDYIHELLPTLDDVYMDFGVES
jgi:hypothetical protein